MLRTTCIAFVLSAGLIFPAVAHVGEHPSVHDTVAGIVIRLTETYDADTLRRLDPGQVLAVLTREERHILGTEHLTFKVNVPVVVSVVRDMRSRDEPFWLSEQGFEKTKLPLERSGLGVGP